MHLGELGMSWASSRNASADVYERASRPTLLTIRLKDSHTCGSSSTMYTVGVAVVMVSPGNWDCANRQIRQIGDERMDWRNSHVAAQQGFANCPEKILPVERLR